MNTAALIERLVEDNAPCPPVLARSGQVALAASAIATIALVVGYFGLKPQLVRGTFDAVVLLVAALFALLAIAAGLTATRMAQPAVGGSQGGGLWVFAVVLLFPAIALVEYLVGHPPGSQPWLGVQCLTLGIGASLFAATVLTLHLRRGAPVLPERAGLLTGLAAGAVGALALTLECGGSTFAHLAFWHVGIVATWAMIGRFAISRLIRW